MIGAYDELYLSDAMRSLANAFDYAINDCNLDSDFFEEIFLSSKYSGLFQSGNPYVISGMSGYELAIKILSEVYQEFNTPKRIYKEQCTPEFWAGWALAQYQWYSSRSFKDILNRISLSNIISMYSIYHELDINHFYNALDNIFKETNLKRIRESRCISQSQLALQSQVSLRSIQLYEQRVNNIDKAQAHTLYKLSKALCCDITDLLEEPDEIE